MVRFAGDLLTLEDFLKLPEFKPPLEYIEGRVIQKVSPNRPHGVLQSVFGAHLLNFVMTQKIGMIYSDTRCSFGGISYIPDLSFIARGRIPRDRQGELSSEIHFAPDLAIEILSPGQTVKQISKKIRFGIQHGVRLGWLLHPVEKQVYVLRPRRRVEILKGGAILTGEDILPGYLLSLKELFSWQAED